MLVSAVMMMGVPMPYDTTPLLWDQLMISADVANRKAEIAKFNEVNLKSNILLSQSQSKISWSLSFIGKPMGEARYCDDSRKVPCDIPAFLFVHRIHGRVPP